MPIMYLCSKFQSFISRNYTCSPHESSRPSAGDLPTRERLTINRWRVKPSMASLRIDFLCFIGTIVYNNLWMEVCLLVNSQNANCKTSICRLGFFHLPHWRFSHENLGFTMACISSQWIQWPFQEPIHWSYLPYNHGLNFREYPPKIWPEIWYSRTSILGS